MKKFLDIKKQFKDFASFLEWLNIQEFSDLRKGNISMDYCELQLGNRQIQHRVYGLKHGLGNIFAPMMQDESFYTWDGIFGETRAEALAKQYDAKTMEAPYCETEGQNLEFILIFNTFEGCAQYLWDTAEQNEKLIELFTEHAGTKTPQQLYEMSLI